MVDVNNQTTPDSTPDSTCDHGAPQPPHSSAIWSHVVGGLTLSGAALSLAIATGLHEPAAQTIAAVMALGSAGLIAAGLIATGLKGQESGPPTPVR